jgi:hypothetical protein
LRRAADGHAPHPFVGAGQHLVRIGHQLSASSGEVAPRFSICAWAWPCARAT